MDDIRIAALTQDRFDEAVKLVLQANLDTKEEIEHHLKNVSSQFRGRGKQGHWSNWLVSGYGSVRNRGNGR